MASYHPCDSFFKAWQTSQLVLARVMNGTDLFKFKSPITLTNLVLVVIQPHAGAGIINNFLELLLFERSPSREKLENRDPE